MFCLFRRAGSIWERRVSSRGFSGISLASHTKQIENEEKREKKKTVFPSKKKVVVIGGGVIGGSVAYHLGKKGWGEDVLLLERASLTSGTTWHAAGLIGQLRGSEEETRLSKYGAELYSRLEEETGYATGFRQSGSLTVARTPERMEQLKVTAARANSFQIPNQIWSQEEIEERYPLIRTDDLLGGLWLPEDGTATSSDCTMAMISGARQQGVKVMEGFEVVDFEINKSSLPPKISGVYIQPRGTSDRIFMECDVVVNCAGQWARDLYAKAGIFVPLYSAQHYYIVSKPISKSLASQAQERDKRSFLVEKREGGEREREEMVGEKGVSGWYPLLRDPDGFQYAREWSGGLLVGCFENNALPAYPDGTPVPCDTEFSLFDFDWDHFSPMMEQALHRFPVLENVEIRDTVNGPESFTADNRYILGEAPNLSGFYVAAGFNSSGIASAPGAGKMMAEWITAGVPEKDVWAVDLRRFSDFHCNTRFLRERAVESLGLHYAVNWPRLESTSARGVRRSPFYNILKEKGAVFGASNGWERPLYFDQENPNIQYSFTRPAWIDKVAKEHTHTRSSVSLFDQSSLSKYLIQGKGAEEFLEYLCANRVGGPVGKVAFSQMLDSQGKIQGDLTITKLSDSKFLAFSGSTQTTRDLQWMNSHLAKTKYQENVTITDFSSALSVLSVMGPHSRKLLEAGSPSVDFSNSSFPFFRSKEIEFGYGRVIANRMSYVGELGWELYIPSEMAPGVYEYLWEISKRENIDLLDSGYYALDSLRIEKGYTAWGRDCSANDTPFEVGTDKFIKWNSNLDFIGKEAVLKLRSQSPERQLLSFKLEKPQFFPLGSEPIFRNGLMVGYLTSSAWSPTFDVAIALGSVDFSSSVLEEGENDHWEIQSIEGKAKVIPSLGPLFDPKGTKLRG